ncbi:hypothetical protein SK128_018647, partial [Halocaridina rubra]
RFCKGLDAECDHHHRKFTGLQWQRILEMVAYRVNSTLLLPDGPDPLELQPVTGNYILFPHGQHSHLQPQETITKDLWSMLNLVQQRAQAF